MKVEWQKIDGEQYFNDPARGWLKRLYFNEVVPRNAFYALGASELKGWALTTSGGTTYSEKDCSTFGLVYAVPCDPPCTLTPQDSFDVCLEYVSYKVSEAAQKLSPEVKEVFLQKVYALKQTFALEVEKLLEEVKHG